MRCCPFQYEKDHFIFAFLTVCWVALDMPLACVDRGTFASACSPEQNLLLLRKDAQWIFVD